MPPTDRELMQQPLRTHWEGCEEVHPECKQPEQEPVAWLVQYSNKHEFVWGQKPQWIADAIGIEPLYTAPQRKPLTDDLYNELLFAVGNKYPNETRHQTALRYILQAEKGDEKAAHGIKGGEHDPTETCSRSY